MIYLIGLIALNTTIMARHFLRQEYYEKVLINSLNKRKDNFDALMPSNKYEC